MIVQRRATERCEACGQLAQRQLIARHDVIHHRIDHLSALKVMGHQRKRPACGGCTLQRALAGVGERQLTEGVKKSVKKAALDVFTLEPDVAHGFKKQALFDVTPGFIRHLEQRFIGTVKQHLQPVFELLRGFIVNLQQNDRQARKWRTHRQLCRGPVGRSHFPVILHPSLLERCSLANDAQVAQATFDARKQKPASASRTRRCI